MYSVSEKDKEYYRQAFALFDKDSSGSINCKELKKVMESLGQSPSVQELEEIITVADVDQSGMVDLDEFCQLMERYQKKSSHEQQLAEAFRVFDKDASGQISLKEFHDLLKELGENTTDIEQIIKQADLNGDGQISHKEFIAMLLHF